MPGIPKPFKRPAIDLGGVKREWVTIEAQYIVIGDTVPDHGVVKEIKYFSDHDIFANTVRKVVRLDFSSGKRLELPHDQMTFVFH